MGNKVGAPPGGRVHWVLWELPGEFKRSYKTRFDYEYHNYHFTRYSARTPIDEFIVIRTSRRCFRCMYYNYDSDYFEYFSARSAKAIADKIFTLFKKVQWAERQKGRDT